MELDRPHYRTTNSSSNSTNSELFICFASRLSSSSSMKISKSILSPGRARDPPVSLSTSLSRRLRSNGSMKGGQASPMFPAGGGGGGGKKRGCAFENPEPSSPKVTCIGQVRVKTKKKKNKAKQTRSLSRRRSGGGEVSFRKVEQQGHDLLGNSEENVHGRGQRYPPSNSSTHFQQPGGGECIPPHRNQRWVHLPVTICEALRTFGAEFSCLLPCRSSCFSTNEREKEEKLKNGAAEAGRRREGEEERAGNGGGENSCGAVFARWFVALQDCEGRQQGRQIELVVGGEEEDNDEEEEKNERSSLRRSSRRHVFEDIEIKEDDTIEVKGGEDEEEKEARLSVCIPPKNALLLMRCRSDPMKMATLTNRFWESPAAPQYRHDDDEDEDVEDEEEEEEEEGEDPDNENGRDNHFQYTEVTNVTTEEVEAENLASERRVSTGYAEIDSNLGTGMQEDNEEDQKLGEMLHNGVKVEVEDESEYKFCSVEVPADQEMAENRGEKPIMEMEKEEEESSRMSHSSSFSSSSGNSEKLNLESDDTEKETLESFASPVATEIEWVKAEESTITEGKKATEENINQEKEKTAHQNFDLQEDSENHKEEKEEAAAAIVADAEDGHDEIRNLDKTTQNNQEESSVTSSSKVLPDCLLLMMCEPKLSMEVSKETWVCSTDFIRWLPERHAKKVNPTEEQLKKKVVVSTDSNNPGHQATTENKTLKPKTRQMQQHLLQPPRSSCSLPAAAAAASMATMIEQKLVNAVGYEPFVLTRCKSEPMRTAAAKLAPDSCFWNNRKLEPHRPAAFGVGAAGVGF